MERRLISSGSDFEEAIGYSRAVVQGNWLFVAGTTGFNYQTMTIAEGLLEQAQQCLLNIEATLEQAGFTWSDLVRVNYIFPHREDFEPCWPIFRKYLGEVKPASTMIVAGLADSRMKLEIEVTAFKQPSL